PTTIVSLSASPGFELPESSGSPEAHPERANAAPTATAPSASRPLFRAVNICSLFSLLGDDCHRRAAPGRRLAEFGCALRGHATRHDEVLQKGEEPVEHEGEGEHDDRAAQDLGEVAQREA